MEFFSEGIETTHLGKTCTQLEEKIIKEFICEFCNNKLKTKRNLMCHKLICKEKDINKYFFL